MTHWKNECPYNQAAQKGGKKGDGKGEAQQQVQAQGKGGGGLPPWLAQRASAGGKINALGDDPSAWRIAADGSVQDQSWQAAPQTGWGPPINAAAAWNQQTWGAQPHAQWPPQQPQWSQPALPPPPPQSASVGGEGFQVNHLAFSQL